MFREKWIEDCSTEEALRRQEGHCEETNQPVTEESDCGCVAHKLFGAASAGIRYSTLVESYRELTSRYVACQERCKELEASFYQADRKASDLGEAFKMSQREQSAALVAEGSAKRELAAAKQTISDYSREHRDLKLERDAAVTELSRVKAIVRTLA